MKKKITLHELLSHPHISKEEGIYLTNKSFGKKKLGPKGNPVGRKAGSPDNPSNRIIAGIMGEFLSLITGTKKATIQSYFSRDQKSLSSLEDCRDFLLSFFKKCKTEKKS